MMKKVVALLMALMLMMSMMPAYAAADNAAQIGKYYEVNDSNGTLPSAPSLSEGNTQQAYSATAGGEELIWVDKTIAPTGTENLFDVTLEVVTGQKIEHIDLTEDAATVLVIDVSGSMDDYDGGSTRRLTRAKRAAQTFINTFADVDSDVTRKVAIVKFSTTATTVSGTNNNRWVDADSVDTTSNTTYCAPINALQYSGGTNIEAGMILAKNLLNDPAIADIKNKNIVLLTDGKPTYGVSDRGENNSSTTTVPSSNNYVIGDGNNTSCDNDDDTHEDVEALCQDLKDDGNGMYAVYIGSQNVNCEDCSLNKSGQNWLAQDCGFAAYSATDADKLVQIFENISLQIAARAQAWVVTDPMGAMVDYVPVDAGANVPYDENAFSYNEEKDTVEWDLKLDNTFVTNEADGTYTYTAKYRISLDTMAGNFSEGTWYPTNKETQVTWVLLDEEGNISGADQEGGGIKKAFFNIPSVQGYKAPLKKIDEAGKALAGAEFTLAHSDNCPDCTASAANKAAWASVKGVSGSDGTITFDGSTQIPSGHTYTLTETKAPAGYELAAAPLTVVVAYGKANGAEPLNVTNYPLTSATVVKVWDDANNQDGKRPASLTVTLSNGTEVILNEDNDWTATVNDLPVYANGVAITYTWTEGAMPEGYSLTNTSVDGTVTTLTNSYTPETTQATVTKVWDDANNQDGKRPDTLTVTLSNGTEVILNEDNNWTATVNDLPVYANGVAITYTWTEGTMPAGYSLTNTSVNGTVTTLTNSYTPETTQATVTKVWNDANNQDGKRPDTLVVTLSNGFEVTLTAADNWTATVIGLPKYENGVEITYTWTEGTVPAGYTLTSNTTDGTVTTITNSYDPEKTSATVTKVWNDAENQDGKRPDTLTVTLSNGTEVILNEDNDWTATVNDLPVYANGEAITYTWTEGTMPAGYTLTSNTTDGTVTTLTNSYTPELKDITVQKVWSDSGISSQRPASITVNLLANGEVVGTASITPDASGSWAHTFPGLPVYEAGTPIEYTVTEEPVEGYTPAVNGFTITNSRDTGALTVTKTVVGALESDNNPAFSFTVTLSDTSINGTFGGMTFNNGVATISLAHGESATATGLPSGVGYTVEEAEQSYFTNTGATGATGTITAGETATAAFTNTRKGAVALNIPVTKTVKQTGDVVPPAQSFKFAVKVAFTAAKSSEPVAANQVRVTIGSETKLLSNGDTFEFTIDTDGAGSYVEEILISGNEEDLPRLVLTITEDTSAPEKYWTYDGAKWTVSVTGSGSAMTTNCVSSKEGTRDEVVFVNSYNQKHFSLEIPFTKTVVQKGTSGVGRNTFYFEINSFGPAEMKVEAVSNCVIEKLDETLYAMTIDGACTAQAKIVLDGDESEMPEAVELRELTSKDGSVTYKALLKKNWKYDRTAKDADLDGEAFTWIIQPAEGSWSKTETRLVDNNGNTVASGNAAFVNEYTDNADFPATGDESNITMWLMLMLISALGFVVISKRVKA